MAAQDGERSGPVFLHGLWRSGSTYAWSRFRAAQSVVAFFEPLYPGLARLTPERIAGTQWRGAVADNRHPPLDRPYYAEYAPLLKRRGVKGFRRSFAFDRFVLEADDAHPALAAYVDGLIGHAAATGARAVLGDNRTWLRVDWLRSVFGGYHLHVERDPLAVWRSYMSHAAQGNFGYFTNLHRIVERNADHPLFEGLAERLRLRRGLLRLRSPPAAYAEAFTAMSAQESYGLVYALWLLSALQGLGRSDTVIDSDLAERPGYAAALERRVAQGCGLAVDFSDLRRVGPDQALAERREVEREALDRLPPFALRLLGDPSAARRRLAWVGPAKAEALELAIGRLTRLEAAAAAASRSDARREREPPGKARGLMAR